MISGILALYLLACSSPAASAGSPPTAEGVVENFYRSYLGSKSKPKPALKFSKSFQKLILRNAKTCRAKAGPDTCGWGAHGDVYLDAQEYDPQSYDKAGASVTELAPGNVQAKFNVYPSAPNPQSYDRTLVFRMIRESGSWVVDDIIYENRRSARKQLQDETKALEERR
jgi:hypothetical protein